MNAQHTHTPPAGGGEGLWGRCDAILAQRVHNHRGLASFAVALICRTLPPLRPDVPERHLDLRAVDFALRESGPNRWDLPPGPAEDVAKCLLGHRRPWPLVIGGVGVGETAE